jgi:hypothetical protein
LAADVDAALDDASLPADVDDSVWPMAGAAKATAPIISASEAMLRLMVSSDRR